MWNFILSVLSKFNVITNPLKGGVMLVALVCGILLGNYVADMFSYKDKYENLQAVNTELVTKLDALIKMKSTNSDNLNACLKREEALIVAFTSTDNLFNNLEVVTDDRITKSQEDASSSKDSTTNQDELFNIEKSIQRSLNNPLCNREYK